MLKKYIRILTKSPFQLPYLVWIKIYKKILGNKKNIHFTGKISFIGVPLVDLHDDAALEIGDNVTLTSLNRGYHLNLHSPVKLFADKPGAMIKIGENTRIHGTCIHATKSVVIGKNCLIAANCQIIDNNGHKLSFEDVENRINTEDKGAPIVIEDNVWIGANTFILPGVTIGEGSVISANSVVIKDIPSMVLAGGNPAKIIKHYP